MLHNEVIHTSKWAITKRCGEMIKKFYLFNLLRLSTQLNVRLYFDHKSANWVAEVPYLRLHPLFDGRNTHDTLEQLRNIFDMWEYDRRYCALVSNDWEPMAKPYFINLLTQYLTASSELGAYLSVQKADHFIHGDFRLSNVLRDRCERIVVLDFENAMIGPRLWDETTLVYNLIEEHQYELAMEVFDSFHCPWMMLLTIAGIRLAQSRKKSLDDSSRMKAYEFILNHSKP